MKGLEFLLDKYINNTIVHETGQVLFIKELVDRVRNMKIEIYSNDHNPPHFHVKSKCGTIDAKFSLNDCSFISGDISSKDQKRIEAFFKDKKEELNKTWEVTRPSAI